MILALDPATRTGFAHSNGQSGCWDLGGDGRHQRLRDWLYHVKRNWGLDRIVYEDAGFASPHSARVAAFHSELRGVIKLVADELGIPAHGVNPTSLKVFATGSGRADKQQMIDAYARQFGTRFVDDNECDAAWLLKWGEANPNGPPETVKQKKRRVRQGQKQQPRLNLKG